MSWTFPIDNFEAHPTNRDHCADNFVIPGVATPLFPLVSGRVPYFLAVQQDASGDYLYWASPRSGSPIPLDAERVEAAMIAGAQRALPARPNAITFLNRILRLPEHMAGRLISHIENSSIKTIYQDNLDLGNALRSAYRTLGHTVQRDMEICLMASQLLKAEAGSARDSLMKTLIATRPNHWIDEAIRRSNEMRANKKAAEQGSTASMDNMFGFR